MNKRRSTIYDLAELAQVSASTVSAVLNGNWKERRIAEATALKVQRLAATHKYNVNRQASGLRKSRSGLIGMIIPMHDNRFFSGMSQAFERLARERHWYPIVVSTLRDPALEVETVSTLISYRIEYLVRPRRAVTARVAAPSPPAATPNPPPAQPAPRSTARHTWARAARPHLRSLSVTVPALRHCKCASSASSPTPARCAPSSSTSASRAIHRLFAPARGPPRWDLPEAARGQLDPQAQPAPAYQFDQRIAW